MSTATLIRPSDRVPAAKGERLTVEQKRARVQQLADRLADYRASLDEDDVLAQLAMFGEYSANNALLILMQRPDATLVRGYKQWRAVGRQVRKGESGIQILAPAGESKDEREAVDVQATDGESKTKTRRWYRIAFVFDLSQTDPIGDAS